MMLSKKLLYWSVAIVWISVFIKCNQKSLRFLNGEPEVESTGDRFRFRKKFRETVQKATNKLVEKTGGNYNEYDDYEREQEEITGDRFRFGKKLKQIIQKAADKLSNTVNGEEIDDYDLVYGVTESSVTRTRDKIKDKFRKVKEKVRPSIRTSIPNKFDPQYNFGSVKTSPPIPVVDDYEHEDFILPYKPGDFNNSVIINLAKNIIRSGNYMRNGINNHRYQLGLYNDYNYRPGEYAEVNMTSTCTNYLEYGGVVFGRYICPVEGYSLNSNQCCGPTNEKYCCEPVSENNYSRHEVSPNMIYFYLFIIVPLVLALVIGVALCIFFRDRICLWYERVRGDAGDDDDEEYEKEKDQTSQ